MKALYPPLSYAIFIALSVIALLAIMTFTSVFTDTVQKNYVYAQLDFVSESIRDEILKLYSTNATGRFQLNIPRDIVGRQYIVELNQDTLNLRMTIGNKRIEASRFVNISASMSGSTLPPASIEIERIYGSTFVKLV